MARRKHGEGSVFPRKDGRWVAQIRLENGKHKQSYHKTEKEAQVALRKMLHEQEQGTLVTAKQQTLKAYLEKWMEQVQKSRLRIGTYDLYCRIIKRHIVPALGFIPLQRLTPEKIESFYADKLEEGLSESSVRRIHAILHVALKKAVRWGLVSKNVCDFVDAPVTKEREMTVLTQEQAKKLLELASKHKLEAILTVALATGMREGELIALRWQDIDFNSKSLQVIRSRRRINGLGPVETKPKTAKGKRKITLPAFAIEALQKHHERQQEKRAKLGSKWKETDAVFTNFHGGYLEANNLLRDFKKLLERVGLPKMRFHYLRHTTATILFSMGVHPKVVQELLGHSNITVTLNIYSHVLPSIQQEAMDKLDGLFGE